MAAFLQDQTLRTQIEYHKAIARKEILLVLKKFKSNTGYNIKSIETYGITRTSAERIEAPIQDIKITIDEGE
jgi:hypothetical protein